MAAVPVHLSFQCSQPSCPEAGVPRPVALPDDVLRQLRESGKTKVRLKCPRCGTPVVLPLPEKVPVATPDVRLPDELGYLLLGETGQRYPLRLGRNVIGKVSASKPADVALDTSDPHLSRQHCTVEVRLGPIGRLEYLLSDANETGDAPMSLNGTFVNDRPQPLRPQDCVYLQDGDTLRLGATRLTLQGLGGTFTVPASARNSPYPPTVIL